MPTTIIGERLTLALVCIISSRSVPRQIVVERQTLATVWTGRVVLTLTDQTSVLVPRRRLDAVTTVTVTFTPASANQ